MHAAHDLAALCRERLGEARIEPDVSAFLERESGGSVRIAAALLDAALRFGTVIRMRGAYVWTGTALPPGSLDVLVDELLGEAAGEPAARDLALLDAAPAARLAALSSLSSVSALQRTGLITARFGELSYVSPALATAVRDRIEPSERRARLRLLMELIGRQDPPEQWPGGELLGYVAAALSCDEPLPLALLRRAADEVRRRGDPETQQRLAAAIARHTESTADERLLALAEQLGSCLLTGAVDQAAATAATGERLLAGEVDVGFPARMAFDLARADLAQYHRDDLDTALATLDDLEAALPALPATGSAEPDAALTLRMQRAVRLGWAGRARDAAEVIDELFDVGGASARRDEQLLLLAAPATLILAQRGELLRALAVADRFRDAARRSTAQRRSRGDIVIAAHVAQLLAGHLAEAERTLRSGSRVAEPPGVDDTLVRICAGVLDLTRGRPRAAIDELETVIAHYDVRDPHRVTGYALAHLGLAYAMLGESEIARDRVDEARDRLDGGGRVLRLHSLEVCARAELWCGLDVRRPALALAESAGDEQLAVVELRALHVAAAAAPALAAELRERAVALSLGIASRSARALARHVGELADGVAPSDRSGPRLLAECGIPTPVRGLPGDLTAREREVAELALLRMPSRTIAERLGVSKRTVDSHIANIYGKLGVSGRDELAAALDRW